MKKLIIAVNTVETVNQPTAPVTAPDPAPSEYVTKTASKPYAPPSMQHDEAPQPPKLKTPKILQPKTNKVSPIQVSAMVVTNISNIEIAAAKPNHQFAHNHHLQASRWSKDGKKDFHMMLAMHHHSLESAAKKRGFKEYSLTPEMHKEASKYHSEKRDLKLHGPLANYHAKKAGIAAPKLKETSSNTEVAEETDHSFGQMYHGARLKHYVDKPKPLDKATVAKAKFHANLETHHKHPSLGLTKEEHKLAAAHHSLKSDEEHKMGFPGTAKRHFNLAKYHHKMAK